jgi:hypothetical protein
MIQRLLTAAIAFLIITGLALAQTPDKLQATVKMVDPDKGKMLISIVKDGAIKIVEYDLGKDVKFLDEKGKPIKGGLKSDVFKSDNNRPAVPITMSFTKDGGVKSVQLRKTN